MLGHMMKLFLGNGNEDTFHVQLIGKQAGGLINHESKPNRFNRIRGVVFSRALINI